MKRKYFLVGLVVYPILFAATSVSSARFEFEEKLEIEPKPIHLEINPVSDLIDALIVVESNGNESAVGDRHLGAPSIGVLQIRPIMVREVNRILKLKNSDKRYSLKDRFNKEKSIEMFMIWYEFHHKDSDFEAIARSWNGGPKGPKNPKTYNYWKKVENQLTELN
jgi:hypothetical protein